MNLDLSSLPMPIRLRPETPMSDKDLMRFSGENKPFRMEREPHGEILIMTPADYRTGSINRRIIQALGIWADNDGRGQVSDSDTGFKLPNGAVRAPDTAWVSNGRLNALSEAEQEGYAPLCPEFVIELVSPSDRIEDVKKMVDEWIANGAELAWLIEPKTRRVTIYRRGRRPRSTKTRLRSRAPVVWRDLIWLWTGSGDRGPEPAIAWISGREALNGHQELRADSMAARTIGSSGTTSGEKRATTRP